MPAFVSLPTPLTDLILPDNLPPLTTERRESGQNFVLTEIFQLLNWDAPAPGVWREEP